MKTRKRVSQKMKASPRGENGTAGASTEKSLVQVKAKQEVALAPSRAEVTVAAEQMLAQAGGVNDPDLAALIIEQVGLSQAVWPFGDRAQAVQLATQMMLEIKPQNLVEAMLATQMIGVHHASLTFLQRAASPEIADAATARATRLMRLFNEQAELLQRMKGNTAEQRVTVKHVHVHDGGQAIVGAVGSAELSQEGGNEKTKGKTP